MKYTSEAFVRVNRLRVITSIKKKVRKMEYEEFFGVDRNFVRNMRKAISRYDGLFC